MKHYKIIFIKYSDIKKESFQTLFHKVIFLIKKRTNLQSISLFFESQISLQDDSTPRLKTIHQIIFPLNSVGSIESLSFHYIKNKQPQKRLLIFWRKERDSNPRCLYRAHTISSRAP